MCPRCGQAFIETAVRAAHITPRTFFLVSRTCIFCASAVDHDLSFKQCIDEFGGIKLTQILDPLAHADEADR